MPQFDFYSFSSQVFWSLSGFFIFYFFILRFYLPNLSEVLKFRKKLTSTYNNNLSSNNVVSKYDSILLTQITK